jgi:hypothetical protein
LFAALGPAASAEKEGTDAQQRRAAARQTPDTRARNPRDTKTGETQANSMSRILDLAAMPNRNPYPECLRNSNVPIATRNHAGKFMPRKRETIAAKPSAIPTHFVSYRRLIRW